MTRRSMRWMAYARWQAVDALWQRMALPFVLTALIIGLAFYSAKAESSPPGFWATPEGVRIAGMLLRQAMTTFIPLAVLMGVNGLVAQDRQKGFYRFYFSKPVPVTGFYLSAFLVSGAAAVAGAAAIAALIGWYAAPQQVLGVAMACALTFALLGGMAFLFSALTANDGILLILAWVVSLLLRQIERGLPSGHWLRTAVRALPPLHRLDAVRDALYAGQAWNGTDVWHVLGYGGACLVVGLVAVRKLPLAR